MPKLIVANWKLHPATLMETMKLARASDKKNVVICPPFAFLSAVKKVTTHASLGAQDVFWEEKGPHTGEVSAAMLANIGVSYVIVGHSERRKMGETNEVISAKVAAALMAGLRVILCVGESASVRAKGMKVAEKFVANQLAHSLGAARAYRMKLKHLIVAYEPVWAIGTGKSDKPEEAAQMIKKIKKMLVSRYTMRTPKVLYGGSVHAKNAKGFLRVADGVLVGGGSIKPTEFRGILRAV